MSSYVSEATVPVSGGSRSSESSRSIIFWIKTLGKWCSGKRQLLDGGQTLGIMVDAPEEPIPGTGLS